MQRNQDHTITLGEFEELVLLAILRLEDQAYGVPIRELLQEVTGRSVSVGALYITLDRLENKGLLNARQSEPTPERGGRAKRYFEVSASGKMALERAESARRELISDLSLALR